MNCAININPATRLSPGTGWSGATSQPGAVGNPAAAGYSENAIAQWDVVRYQTFSGMMYIGIVAFHMEGISSVQFSVNNGPWVSATVMTFNGQVQVTEYTAILNAADYPDGLIEIRAIIYPVSGVPVVLQGSDFTAIYSSLFLYANSGGTYNPTIIYLNPSTGSDSNNGLTSGAAVATIDKALDIVPDGGTVRLMVAGTYTLDIQNTSPRFGNPRNHLLWTTIEPDSSLTPSQVILNGNGRTYLNHLRLHNLSGDTHALGIYIEPGFDAWADGVVWTNSVGWSDSGPSFGPLRPDTTVGLFYTDCAFHNTPWGPTGANIARNTTLTQMSADILDGGGLVVNTKVAYARNIIAGYHDDICQCFGTHQNCIVYGLTATDIIGYQDMFLDKDESSNFRDMAFVNYVVSNVFKGDGDTQYASPERHIYLKSVTISDQPMLWRTDFIPDGSGNSVPFSGTNFVLDGVTVSSATYSALQSPTAGVIVKSIINSGQ